MKFIFLLSHIAFGVLSTLLAAVALHYSLIDNFKKTIRFALSEFIASSLATIAAALYYVLYYQTDKKIILDGQLPITHSVFMEVKEHAFILFFLLSIYFQLRIWFTAIDNSTTFKRESRMVLISIVCLGLLMSAMGIIVNMGFRVNQ